MATALEELAALVLAGKDEILLEDVEQVGLAPVAVRVDHALQLNYAAGPRRRLDADHVEVVVGDVGDVGHGAGIAEHGGVFVREAP